MPNDLWVFVRALVRDWISWMSGAFGLAWTVTTLCFPQAPAWIFGVVCLFAVFLACFRVWRAAYREARPYDEETFRHAGDVFTGLGREDRTALERIVVQKSVAAESVPNVGRLEQTGFVRRDGVTGRLTLTPEYVQIVTRIIGVWRVVRAPAPGT